MCLPAMSPPASRSDQMDLAGDDGSPGLGGGGHMRRAYRVLAYVIAVEVIVQAMMIATGVAGLDHWIEHDHATVTKHVLDKNPSFTGSFGFAVHAINGEMLIPLLAIVLLI